MLPRRARGLMVAAAVGVAITAAAVVRQQARGSSGEEELPAGPLRERHELMEQIGADAKKVGRGVKAGDHAAVAEAAEKINAAAGRITGLFPEGSLHPRSRAKPEIWKNWAEFTAIAQRLQDTSARLVTAAKEKGDMDAASKAMFDACKSCHDQFRVPED